MPLFSILITLILVGIVLWLLNSYIPMDGKIKTILNVVVVIIVILWLLNAFAGFDFPSHLHLGSMRWRR
jgi:hypothetical protein